MGRIIRATLTSVLALGLYGAVTPEAYGVQRDCIAGSPAGKCLWDGGNVGYGFDDEAACESAADRYNGQDPSHDYECEDV
ncbi:hypothetical protein [Streptomyces sp. NPDC056160]|uniref:hypothetical protein n=1 Tax=Streptomyces sp. NPDC056160 TaxID=3345731 RepID=UPI0035D54C4C